MSDALAQETANSVPEHQDTALQFVTTPAVQYDEKHKETSRKASASSLNPNSKSSSSLPQDGLAAAAAGGNASEAQSTLVNTNINTANPSPPPEVAQNDEKGQHAIEEHGSTDPTETEKEVATVTDTETANAGVEDASNADEDEIVYPQKLQLALLTFGLCMATFTVALDNTIIATAIPKITTVFDSLGDVGWYGSSYLLTTTALQPSFGRIYTYFNVKYTYLFALCLFELGSIICASARNSVMLIVGRAVAGAGASALFSGGGFPRSSCYDLLTVPCRNDYRWLHCASD